MKPWIAATALADSSGYQARPPLDPNLPPPCFFMAGTEIATPTGMCLVENLGIGDPVLTASGEVIAVKWIGRRSFVSARIP